MDKRDPSANPDSNNRGDLDDQTRFTAAGLCLEELVEKYQQGDRAATTALIRAVSPLFIRFCLSHGESPQDVEDMVQEIWIRVHRARHTYRAGAPAAPWLYAIARYTRLDFRRRRKRTLLREVPLETVSETSMKFRTSIVLELSQLAGGLPQAQWEVFFMLKCRGMTIAEVARQTASTVGAVKQKAHRAYKQIRKLLSSDNDL
jgi:RNA polymerase sigma-70 factor (ECF subfamily)